MSARRAIIIGGGPAGLTAALELVRRTDLVPTVLDRGAEVGGIASTRVHNGNRIDLGGHRFFTKSGRVLEWWLDLLPLESGAAAPSLRYRGSSHSLDGSTVPHAEPDDGRVMLVRERHSRILYEGRLYPYPLRLDGELIGQLGARRVARVAASYVKALAFPRKEERTLEDFFVNRFGGELYHTFFRTYTEKVWGVPCKEISAEWGAQRVKGLDVRAVVRHEVRRRLGRGSRDLVQTGTETSLVEQFLYPRLGPGQMWEEAARRVEAGGGEVRLGETVIGLHAERGRITQVVSENLSTGQRMVHDAEVVFSTTSIQELVPMIDEAAPSRVADVARGLVYRDFITVGLLLDRLRLGKSGHLEVKDNWIYVHDPGVVVGRIQIFNNWSPSMVASADKVWVGLEYFCNRDEPIWRQDDAAMIRMATEELVRLGAILATEVRDGVVLRVPRTYPAYFGTYNDLGQVRTWLERYPNLYLIGRNGMHRYNNQDHSMLTAMTAVDNIVDGREDRSNLWSINTGQDYQESIKTGPR